MNIVFKKVIIDKFQSVNHIELDLDDRGILVVKGINNYESNVKSNGSGKSSIFESIIFALYGETSLGIKDPENRILNQGYRVQLNVSINGVDYSIIRYKDNKASVQLLQDGVDISGRNKTDTDKMIVKLLGLSKELFLDSIFLAQGVSTNLSTLSPTARKERLEILTGTEKLIDDFKTYIKNRQIQYESKCTGLTINKSKIEGNIQSLASQINTLKSKITTIEQENARKQSLGNIADLETEISGLEASIRGKESDISADEEFIREKQLEVNNKKEALVKAEDFEVEKNNELNEQRNLVNKLNFDIDKLQSEVSNKQRDISRLNKEIDTIKNSDKCPTCGRKYDDANDEHIQQTIDVKNNEINIINTDINNMIADINTRIENVNKETEKGKTISAEHSEAVEVKSKMKLDITYQESLIQEKNKHIKSIRDEISYIQNNIKGIQAKKEELLKVEIQSTVEYENMIADANNQIQQHNIEIELINKEYTEQDNLVNVCKYSQQLITKQFRTYLLQNSINILNEKLLELSKKLFSNSKDVIIIDGDDSKLDIKLGNANYESLSGGEKTRVNICLLLAQKYLASNLGDIECNMIVLDEVLGQCDSEAELNIIDLMINELQSVSSIIFIGHKELLIPNDATITVMKNEQGLSQLA